MRLHTKYHKAQKLRKGYLYNRVDFSGQDIDSLDLTGCIFLECNFELGEFVDCNLTGVKFDGCILDGVSFTGCNRTGTSYGTKIEIPNIHEKIFEVTSDEASFDMSIFASPCGTSFCRAGWVIQLAGEVGKMLVEEVGFSNAAASIYLNSDPTLSRVPCFYSSNSHARASIKNDYLNSISEK